MVTFKTNRARPINLIQVLAKLFLPIGLILLLVLLFFTHQNLLRATQVTCRSSQGNCPQAVENILSAFRGRSLLLLNLNQIKKEILTTGLVDQAEITINLPGQLRVNVTPPTTYFYLNSLFTATPPSLSFENATIASELVPPSFELAAFVATNSGRTFQLISSGLLLAHDSETDYYLITKSIPSREFLTRVFIWLKALTNSSQKPTALFVLDTQIIVKRLDQPDIIVSTTSDPQLTFLALQQLNQTVTIKKSKVIDFRYTHPILK